MLTCRTVVGLLALIVGFSRVPSVLAEDPAEALAKSLQGEWEVTAAISDGNSLDRIVGHGLVIRGETFLIRTKSGDLKGTFTLDASRKPCHMDWSHEEGAVSGTTWKSIVDVKAKSIRICYTDPSSGDERPAKFEAATGSGRMLVTVEKKE